MPGLNRKRCVSTTAISAALITASLSIASCGGSNDPSPPPTPSPPTATTWQKDYYLPRSTYKNRCQFARTGTYPVIGRPYGDIEGSMLDELFYLRSLTHETYLFRADLTDMDPSPYNQVQSTFDDHAVKMDEYFQELKTKELTASNTPKDKYHYSTLTSDYINTTQNVAQPSYGVSWALFSESEVRNGITYTKVPRDLRARYVDPGSPAAELVAGSPKVKRGDKVLKVNGVDYINGDGAALRATYGAPSGTRTTFVLMDVDTKQEKTVVLQSKDITRKPVNKASVLEIGDDKVGYIHYLTFFTKDSDSAFHETVKGLKSEGVTDLVLDLRYNGGGYLDISSMVAYMIAGESNTKDKTFEKSTFHEGAGDINPVTGYLERPMPFHNEGRGEPFSIRRGTKLESLNLSRVYILSTGRTCSASESLINGLIGIDVEVVLVGGTTCGKPYGFYSEDNCGITYSTVQFKGENHKGFGDYTDGFVPSSATSGAKVKGCVVEDDFTKQLGDEEEALLAAALKFRKDGKCPVSPAPPSAPSSIGMIASSDGAAGQPSASSNLEVPEDPFYFDERILIPE